MHSFALSELVQPLGGELLGEDAHFEAVTTDSRNVAAGDLFVALQGEHFDGHAFLESAAQQGATAVLVAAEQAARLPALKVADTRLALGRLGALNRQHFDGKLIGITGSCGKTSVKNMLSAICGTVGSTLATPGNFNNEIGLPLTLLQLEPQHRFAVIEMGAAKQGDIAYLSELAQPEIAVLLNAMPAHLEGFGSVDGVARAKGEILQGLAGVGTAVFPNDSEYSELWREFAADAQCLTFGFDAGAAIYASDISAAADSVKFLLHSPQGEQPVDLPWTGRHNVANALAAAAAAQAAGISLQDIASGLAQSQPESGRLRQMRAACGAQLIDDSYNANPASVAAAVDVLAACQGRQILVLGTMAELGEDSARLHREAGSYAAGAGIDALWASGPFTEQLVDGFGEGGRWFAELESLLAELCAELTADDVVLVKGSRSAGMEQVVTRLLRGEG